MATRLSDVERRDAYLAAYDVFEDAQGEDHFSAVARLPAMAAEAERRSWPEVSFVLAAAQTVHAMTRPDAECDPAPLVGALLRRAEGLDAPALVAIAMGFRAIVASADGDAATLLADVGRAVALLDDTEQSPLDRCTGYVVVAAALNTLQLWELVDEMYTRAAELSPDCEAPAQAAAVAVNRVLIRLEWACALLEDGDEQASREQLQRAEAAVPEALAERLPALWRRDVEAISDILRLLRGADPIPMAAALAEHRRQLSAGNDLEVLPLLDAAWALALVQHGHVLAAVSAARELAPSSSSSSGAKSFPLWVRAQVLAAETPSSAMSAQRDHAVLVGRLRRESRLAVLGAAHAQIAVERRRAEHDRLAHQVNTDALTGLSNRRSFDAWQQAPGPVLRATALLLVDLDGFKAVNDTYGHGCGDEVLRRVGRLISASIRSGDLALRLGGDEFAVLLEDDLLNETAVLERAELLRTTIAGEPWSELADGLAITASIGVAVADPASTVASGLRPTAESIYRAADTALYTAKRRRTGIVVSSGAQADRAQTPDDGLSSVIDIDELARVRRSTSRTGDPAALTRGVSMRKLVGYTLLSADGVAEAPEQFLLDFDDELQEHLNAASGPRTRSCWGDACTTSGPTSGRRRHRAIRSFINATQKYVATSTPLQPGWSGATAIEGSVPEFIRDLKAQAGGDIGVHGSIQLTRSLFEAGLMDELRLVIAPAVVGHGRRLLGDGRMRRLELLRGVSTSSGALIADYRVLDNP